MSIDNVDGLIKFQDFIKNTAFFNENYLTMKIPNWECNEYKSKKYIWFNVDQIKDLKNFVEILQKNDVDISGKLFLVNVNSNAYLTKQQCLDLIKYREFARNLGSDIQIRDGKLWQIEDVLDANEKLDDMVNTIKNARVKSENNRTLNELEKFIWAYTYVANRPYHENLKDFDSSRKITSIFKTGDVVCVGFATILKEICNRLNIECYINHCEVLFKNDDIGSYGHANNIVIINNKPYYCDACWDCLNSTHKEKSYNCCLIPASDVQFFQKTNIINSSAPFFDLENDIKKVQDLIEKLNNMSVLSEDDYYDMCANDTITNKYKNTLNIPHYMPKTSFKSLVNRFTKPNCKHKAQYYYTEILKALKKKNQTTPIPLDEFEKALINVHNAFGYNEVQSKQKVKQILDENLQRASERYEPDAQNCFAQNMIKNQEL